MLFTAALVMPVMLTSCGGDDDEPDVPTPDQPSTPDEEDKFADLYGYWMNADGTGAMVFTEESKSQCQVKYYVYTSTGIKDYTSYYYGGENTFGALTPDGKYTVSVKISSSTQNRMVLKKSSGSGYSELSSYVFTRIKSDEFYDYLETGNETPGGDPEDNGASMLIGTWVGNDYGEIYTLTFSSSGRVKEVWSDGYDEESTTGTYTYSNGNITSWPDSSILANALGDCPWPVVFNSSTSMTLGSGWNKITFTKQ